MNLTTATAYYEWSPMLYIVKTHFRDCAKAYLGKFY